jgi:hypothetical protein
LKITRKAVENHDNGRRHGLRDKASSTTGLDPDCNTWGNATHTLPYWEDAHRSMIATGCPTTSEHSGFFDKGAIQATINTIHNLCLGWLREEYDRSRQRPKQLVSLHGIEESREGQANNYSCFKDA